MMNFIQVHGFPVQLSAHADHGPVLLEGVFGILSFSPDGKYLMYAAEQRVHGKGKSKELMKHHIKSNDIGMGMTWASDMLRELANHVTFEAILHKQWRFHP